MTVYPPRMLAAWDVLDRVVNDALGRHADARALYESLQPTDLRECANPRCDNWHNEAAWSGSCTRACMDEQAPRVDAARVARTHPWLGTWEQVNWETTGDER